MSSPARRVLVSWLTFWICVSAFIVWFLWPLKERLKFGIDLIGGTYLTLKVQTNKAVESNLLSFLQVVSSRLRESNKVMPISKEVKDGAVVLTFGDIAAANDSGIYISDIFKKDVVVATEGKVVKVTYPKMKIRKIKDEAVKTNVEIFKTRLNPLSVEEISVAQKGEDQIIIELPGVADPQRARAMIGKPAVLEFKLVEKSGSSEEDILYEYDGVMPDDMVVSPGRERIEGKVKEYYLVPKYTEVTGNSLKDARVGIGGRLGAMPIVNFKFSPEGGDKFYELTSKNPGKRLAIILDNEVISAPVINAAIRESGYIEGSFSSTEAKELAMLLRSGSLVAPVSVEEDRQIGATLGAESIRKGLVSCLVGLGLLLFFSILYYKVSGVLAFIALIFNLLLVLFGLSSVKATLTLPGIAGMILTVGMAIDASILIYERIKEALLSGVSIRKAVDSGFSTAMTVILDANITTFIVGVVLYKFGTGPIRGFAVTMMLGIIATLITGLFFLRSLFNFLLNNFKIKKLSI